MGDFGAVTQVNTPTHIHAFSLFGVGLDFQMLSFAGAGTLTWVSGLAVLAPIYLPFPYVVRRLWWQNGSTITSTSADCGVYSVQGTKIISTGSTTMSGATNIQYANILGYSEYMLPPGQYYLAWSCNNTTSRASGSTVGGANGEEAGLVQMTSGALPLPQTITFAAYAGQGMPYCGITRTASGF